MTQKIIGTCSLCGGPVAISEPWLGTLPCVPVCQHCGARKKNPYGPVVDMEVQPTAWPTAWPPTPIDWKLGLSSCEKNPFMVAIRESIDELKKNYPA